jgi:two-component system chemotaxis response regulator CheY
MMDVLIVDDSEIIRRMILKTLELAHIPVGRCHEAGNGKEALGILRDEWVDQVIADINMPVLDGVSMVRQMREAPETAAVPVIVVSTEGAAARVEELRGMGVVAYLRKPFTPEQLRDCVRGVTDEWERDDRAAGLVQENVPPVLDRFVFMFGSPTEKGSLPQPGGEVLVAHMAFSGAAEGMVSIAASEELCREMAANVLGEEPDAAGLREREADALGEVLNMACGQIASAIDASAATDLCPPEVNRMPLDDWHIMLHGSASVGFLVEEEPMLVSLRLRSRSQTA